MTCSGIFLVTYITLVCCEGPRRKHPLNLGLGLLLTLAVGYMTSMIASFHDTKVVFLAAGITALVCFSIVLFASQTKVCS